MPRYQPADSMASPRFTGVRTFARLPYVQATEDVDIAIVGLPFDTGATFKVGARFGPESIRSASVMLRPYHVELDIQVFENLSIIDYGDAPVVPGFIEDSYRAIEATLRPLAAAGVITLGLGGDHSIALAELRALAAAHGPLALVQFDSHGDVWDAYYGDHKYTHGTPFRRAVEEGILRPERSIQLGMRGPLYGPEDLQVARDLGFTVLTTTQLLQRTPQEIGELVRATVGDAKAFLSFDVDFFDPAFAPGTGTPEVGGPTSFQGLAYLRACTGLNWVGGDVVEVLPALDHAQITAHLAAQVGYEFLALVALQRRAG
ncbi:MAG TPA: agmatinase [Roseiflexaceae bacterium]|nr:agmatinase [Roseiflexaceae bacterium]HMP42904.1 agmatinase [Roseiflexaceae bacterium]